MCWNKDVSLNTFLFSSFVLLMIWYNNTYTKYKIDEFKNIWVYVFFISFILMQLIEYFIWKNIKNPFYNKVFTILATLLLIVQPVASMMLIKDKTAFSTILAIYLIPTIPFVAYRFMKTDIHSSVSKLGHLQWNTLLDTANSKLDVILNIFWFTFFLFPLFYSKHIFGLLFGLITLLIVIYNYAKDRSVGSFWCWIVNSVMIYYSAYLLLYLPFYK